MDRPGRRRRSHAYDAARDRRPDSHQRQPAADFAGFALPGPEWLALLGGVLDAPAKEHDQRAEQGDARGRERLLERVLDLHVHGDGAEHHQAHADGGGTDEQGKPNAVDEGEGEHNLDRADQIHRPRRQPVSRKFFAEIAGVTPAVSAGLIRTQ